MLHGPVASPAARQRPGFLARAPRAADLRPRLDTPHPPPPTAGDPLHPEERAAVSNTTQPAAAPPTEALPLALDEALKDVQHDMATIHARWLPSTEVFDFTIDDTTTVLALKVWLSAEVGCDAPHMHVHRAFTQLRDEVPLGQYVGHGDTVFARPKRGG